jgi:hypothetical protein
MYRGWDTVLPKGLVMYVMYCREAAILPAATDQAGQHKSGLILVFSVLQREQVSSKTGCSRDCLVMLNGVDSDIAEDVW